jgi:hypothetical protein
MSSSLLGEKPAQKEGRALCLLREEMLQNNEIGFPTDQLRHRLRVRDEGKHHQQKFLNSVASVVCLQSHLLGWEQELPKRASPAVRILTILF